MIHRLRGVYHTPRNKQEAIEMIVSTGFREDTPGLKRLHYHTLFMMAVEAIEYFERKDLSLYGMVGDGF